MAELKRKVSLKQKQTIIEENTAPTPPSAPKKKCKWWIWVLVVAIVAIVAMFFVRNTKAGVDSDPIGTVAENVIPSPVDTNTADGVDPTASEVNDEPLTPSQNNAETTQPAPEPKTTVPAPGYGAGDKTVKTVANSTLSDNLEENAKRVIRGEFGNGKARKDALGSSYDEIQGRVNEIYREAKAN